MLFIYLSLSFNFRIFVMMSQRNFSFSFSDELDGWIEFFVRTELFLGIRPSKNLILKF